MKNLFLYLLLFAVAVSCSPQQEPPSAVAPVLRHVVMFQFKDTATAEDVKRVTDAFTALSGKIATIKDFEWGTNSSPEGLNQGLTHCFFVTFSSDKDRDDYLVHPDHVAFVEVLKPHLEKATVLDYWTSGH